MDLDFDDDVVDETYTLKDSHLEESEESENNSDNFGEELESLNFANSESLSAGKFASGPYC